MKLDWTYHAVTQAKKRGCPQFSALTGSARRVGKGITLAIKPDPTLPGCPKTEAEARVWELNKELRDSGIVCETQWERYVVRKRGVDFCLVITAGNRVLTTYRLEQVSRRSVEAFHVGRRMKQEKLRRMTEKQRRYDERLEIDEAEALDAETVNDETHEERGD